MPSARNSRSFTARGTGSAGNSFRLTATIADHPCWAEQHPGAIHPARDTAASSILTDWLPDGRAVAPPRSADGRPEHHGQGKEEREERHHEGERLDIVGTGRSVLHAITPDRTGPCRSTTVWTTAVRAALRGAIGSGFRRSTTLRRREPQCIDPSTRKTTPPTRTAVRTRAPATSRALTCSDLVSRAIRRRGRTPRTAPT